MEYLACVRRKGKQKHKPRRKTAANDRIAFRPEKGLSLPLNLISISAVSVPIG